MAAPRSLSAPQQLDISNAAGGGSETVQKGDGVSEKGNEQDVLRQGDFQAAEHLLDRRARRVRARVGGEYLLLPQGRDDDYDRRGL